MSKIEELRDFVISILEPEMLTIDKIGKVIKSSQVQYWISVINQVTTDLLANTDDKKEVFLRNLEIDFLEGEMWDLLDYCSKTQKSHIHSILKALKEAKCVKG